MKLLLLAALVSQVVGKPQQGYYQPGNTWSNTAQPTPSGHQHQQPGNTWINTRPAQPTQWSAWSSVESGDPSSYNSYDSYNPYNPYIPNNPDNPYNPYNPHNPYDSYVPGSGGDVNSVSGSVGSPVIQEVGLNQLGSISSPEIVYDQGWDTLPDPASIQPAVPCEPCSSWNPCPKVPGKHESCLFLRGTNAGIVRRWPLRGRFRHRPRN